MEGEERGQSVSLSPKASTAPGGKGQLDRDGTRATEVPCVEAPRVPDPQAQAPLQACTRELGEMLRGLIRAPTEQLPVSAASHRSTVWLEVRKSQLTLQRELTRALLVTRVLAVMKDRENTCVAQIPGLEWLQMTMHRHYLP